jgi:hypothetical protein
MSGSRPAVGSSRMSRSARVANAATSCTFCRLPFEALSPSCGCRGLKLDRTSRYALSVPPNARQELERLGARETRPEHQRLRRRPRAGARPPRRSTRRRTPRPARPSHVKPEQQPDGRRLARSIGSQEAIHLARRDRKAECIERERAPIALRGASVWIASTSGKLGSSPSTGDRRARVRASRGPCSARRALRMAATSMASWAIAPCSGRCRRTRR